MSCNFCTNETNLHNLASAVPGDYKLRYCPVCGTNVAQAAFFRQLMEEADKSFKDAFKKLVTKAEIEKAKKKGETVEIDGETLEFERLPPKKFISKPMDLGIDLDKIDISREMELLKKCDPENVAREKQITERLKRFIKEKEKENENG